MKYDLSELSLSAIDTPAYDPDHPERYPRPDVFTVGHGVCVQYTSGQSPRKAGERAGLAIGGHITDASPDCLLVREYASDRNDPRVFLIDTTGLSLWSYTPNRRTPLGIVETIRHDCYPDESISDGANRIIFHIYNQGGHDRAAIEEGPYVHYDDAALSDE